MADLSPAARAVMDAVEDSCIHPADLHRIAAAALYAAAHHLNHDRRQLAAIATELEDSHG